MENKKSCFVIMPFSKTSEEHDEAYWNDFFCTLKSVVELKGYNCIRSEVGPYKLFSNIVKNIEISDLVIAVLTDYNANVWYELGIRHTLKLGTIMLLQEGQRAPFDINDFGIIFYKDGISFQRLLDEKLGQHIEKMKDNVYDSPVIYARNGEVADISLEKKLEEMRELIKKLVDEIPRDKEIKKTKKIKTNRILWVDDYPSNNEMVINFFEKWNIKFDLAISTNQALQLLSENTYDLIITDMGRGNESDAGLTLLKKIKKIKYESPVIVYASRNAIRKYGDDALHYGAYKVTNGVGNIVSLIMDLLDV